MVGTIYLGTVLVLSVLLGIASRQHHVSSGDVDVYRFPAILINALRFGVAAPALLGFVVYKSFGRPLKIYESAFLVFFFGSITLIIAAQLWVVSHYALELRVGSLTITDWRGRRVISTDAIRRVVVAHPWRGNGYMDLFGADGEKLEHIDAGVQDFEEAVDFVVNQCGPGAVVRERDTGNRWTERIV
jgi:hypothetical protein